MEQLNTIMYKSVVQRHTQEFFKNIPLSGNRTFCQALTEEVWSALENNRADKTWVTALVRDIFS